MYSCMSVFPITTAKGYGYEQWQVSELLLYQPL